MYNSMQKKNHLNFPASFLQFNEKVFEIYFKWEESIDELW